MSITQEQESENTNNNSSDGRTDEVQHPIPAYTLPPDTTVHYLSPLSEKEKEGEAEEEEEEKKLAQRTTSTLGGMLQIICMVVGAGLLNLPRAMAQIGWLSIVFVIFAAFICDWSSSLLIRSLYMSKSGIRLRTFGEIGKEAFGKPAEFVSSFFQKLSLTGISCVFLVVAGNSAHFILGKYVPVPEEFWIILISFLISMPFLFRQTMNELVWTSAVGLFASLMLAVVTIVVCIIELVDTSYSYENAPHPIIDWFSIPRSLAGILFAYSGNIVYPNIESKLKGGSSSFHTAMNGSSAIITVIYLVVGILAFLVYGSDVASPIFKSLPQNGIVFGVIALILVHVVATFPLPYTTLAIDIELMLGIPNVSGKRRKLLFRMLVRLFLMISITIVACLFKAKLPALMDFISAMTNAILMLILPILFYFKLKGWKQMRWFEMILGFISLCTGIMTGTVGTYQAAKMLFFNK